MSNDTQPPRPYNGPTATVTELLTLHDFDLSAVDAGMVEVRIIGEFGEKGATIHHMSMAKLTTQQVKRERTPASTFTVLRSMADAMGRASNVYVLASNTKEVSAIEEGVKELSSEDADYLAHSVVEAFKADTGLTGEDFVPKVGSPRRPAMVDCADAILNILRRVN